MKPPKIVVPGVITQENTKPFDTFEPLGFLPARVPKIHQHDCDQCEWLGSDVLSKVHHDFYRCSKQGYTTYIARYGKHEQYVSFPEFALENMEPQDAITEIIKIEYLIDTAEYGDKNLRFAILQSNDSPNDLTVLVSRLIEPRDQEYLKTAYNRMGELMAYETIRPELYYKIVSLMQDSFERQLRVNR